MKKQKAVCYRQGDILLRLLPGGDFRNGMVMRDHPGAKVRSNGHILEGEATGHIHRIAELNQAQVFDCEGGLYLSVSDAGVSIVHEDHATLRLPAGEYEVIRQREYSPEQIRNVQD